MLLHVVASTYYFANMSVMQVIFVLHKLPILICLAIFVLLSDFHISFRRDKLITSLFLLCASDMMNHNCHPIYAIFIFLSDMHVF
jgi:hypothetical protein